jgi:hypothetical protein
MPVSFTIWLLRSNQGFVGMMAHSRNLFIRR